MLKTVENLENSNIKNTIRNIIEESLKSVLSVLNFYIEIRRYQREKKTS